MALEGAVNAVRVGASLATTSGQTVDDEEVLDVLEALNVSPGQKPSPRALAAARSWATVEEDIRVRQVLLGDAQDELMDRVQQRSEVTEPEDASDEETKVVDGVENGESKRNAGPMILQRH